MKTLIYQVVRWLRGPWEVETRCLFVCFLIIHLRGKSGFSLDWLRGRVDFSCCETVISCIRPHLFGQTPMFLLSQHQTFACFFPPVSAGPDPLRGFSHALLGVRFAGAPGGAVPSPSLGAGSEAGPFPLEARLCSTEAALGAGPCSLKKAGSGCRHILWGRCGRLHRGAALEPARFPRPWEVQVALSQWHGAVSWGAEAPAPCSVPLIRAACCARPGRRYSGPGWLPGDCSSPEGTRGISELPGLRWPPSLHVAGLSNRARRLPGQCRHNNIC